MLHFLGSKYVLGFDSKDLAALPPSFRSKARRALRAFQSAIDTGKPQEKAHKKALAAVRAIGVIDNKSIVHLDGRIYLVVCNDEYPKPTIYSAPDRHFHDLDD